MEFMLGDVVELKSGGPKMTVVGVVGEDQNLSMAASISGYEPGDVAGQYFANNRLEKGMFRASSLKISEE